jgi:tetratricopeptide (TPR) repeat protein
MTAWWLALDRLVRPRPLVALLLLAGAIAIWPAAGLEPGDALEAARADLALLEGLAAGDWDAAAAAGRRRLALAVAPPDVDRAFVIADALVRSGARAEGLATGQRALDVARALAGPDSFEAAVAANNLAWMLATAQAESSAASDPAELERADTLARAAVAHDGENPFFLGTLGAVDLLRGDLTAAEAHLRDAIARHEPATLAATDRTLLAIVLARRGDREGARVTLDAARQDTPDAVWLRRAEEALAAAP